MSIPTLDTAFPQAFVLTEQQELASKLLSAETRASFTTQIVTLGEQLATIKFNGNLDEVNALLRHFAYIQGQRELLLSLVADSNSAYQHLESLGNGR